MINTQLKLPTKFFSQKKDWSYSKFFPDLSSANEIPKTKEVKKELTIEKIHPSFCYHDNSTVNIPTKKRRKLQQKE